MVSSKIVPFFTGLSLFFSFTEALRQNMMLGAYTEYCEVLQYVVHPFHIKPSQTEQDNFVCTIMELCDVELFHSQLYTVNVSHCNDTSFHSTVITHIDL